MAASSAAQVNDPFDPVEVGIRADWSPSFASFCYREHQLGLTRSDFDQHLCPGRGHPRGRRKKRPYDVEPILACLERKSRLVVPNFGLEPGMISGVMVAPQSGGAEAPRDFGNSGGLSFSVSRLSGYYV